VLHRPLLYISHFLKRHRAEYYDRLMAVREDGAWESWVGFFLQGVADTADEATATARSIIKLRDQHATLVQASGLGRHGLRLLDELYHWPLVTINVVAERLGVSFATASKLVTKLENTGVLHEITGGKRSRVFRYSGYLALFLEPDSRPEDGAPLQTTEPGE
jgi:Fic family protein